MSEKILIVEDEARMRRVLQLILENQGYQVETATDGEDGILKWKIYKPDLVFTDLKMPKADGMAVLQYGSRNHPHIPVILLTAFGTIPTAVEAMKSGAIDYITKPVNNEIIIEKTKTALMKKSDTVQPAHRQTRLIGSSDLIATLKKELDLVAATNTSVFITGASGTGKELAARTIHLRSPRKDNPFIRLNCAAIPKELMESELFGHIKGAFTGAVQNRPGAFIRADHGTLFLDEIGDLTYELQAKLLHAVEDKEITPVGSTGSLKVDVKIISATNQNIEQMIKQMTFRSDLYFRLNAYAIHIPPLKNRPEDIPELTKHFLAHFCKAFIKPIPEIHRQAMTELSGHPWPGNVRELKNMVERLVLVSNNKEITQKMVKQTLYRESPPDDGPTPLLGKNLFTREREIIEEAMNACGGNISKAARQLGITRNTLRYRLKKFHQTSS